MTTRRNFLAGSLAALPGVAALTVAGATPATAKDKPVSPSAARDIAFQRWHRAADFAAGTHEGTVASGDAIALGSVAGTVDYTDPFGGGTRRYEYARWTAPWVTPGFDATEAIPSWNADTAGGTWVQVDLRGVTAGGATTKWYVLGRWAAGDTAMHRTSVASQGDTHGSVAVDTFVAAAGHPWRQWQLRVTLLRPAGTAETPTVRSVGAVASAIPTVKRITPSAPGVAAGLALELPPYSQNVHSGHYPEWDNGGEAWCSPTSTSMVLSYWGTGPAPADYDWVEPKPHQDPWVDYAARNTFDHSYDGCGNWPFNTAYAARFGVDGFVTRLRSMAEAEQFIAAGIPLVASASWKRGEIPGADYGTNGHLLVIAGFTSSGDIMMNDPAAASNAGVRKVFGRAQYENAWLTTSLGVVYVVHPPTVALPPPPDQANW